jgi:AcrR family transcriptional regulator
MNNMRGTSQMSSVLETTAVTARAPRRKRGQLRVAALLEAAAAVFAERGFELATMTEIAARAKAPIGSLYQFFPNKDVLGAALMHRYLELAVRALSAIEERAQTLSAEALAGALLHVFADLKQERAAAISMLDAMPGRRHTGVGAFRATVLEHIVRVLKARRPRLTSTRVDAMALAVLMQLKSAAALESHTRDTKATEAALRELRAMLTLYIEAT